MPSKHSIKNAVLSLTIGLLLISSSLSTWGTESPPEKPNIILIFTDDQGYADVGCFGAKKIRTPHLDQMAKEGMKFTNFYSASSICSPSRAALLTGCYPHRVSIPRVFFPQQAVGLNPEEITIAEMLKEQGYATACIGKWHLGHKPHFLPTRQGFDTYFGIPYSNDMYLDPTSVHVAEDAQLFEGMTVDRMKTERPRKNWVQLMRDEKIIEYPCDQTTLTKRYTEEALQFIQKNKEKPFFLYLPHTMPHIPLYASAAFKGKSEEGLYGDTIEEIDWSVGQILAALKEQGIDEKTLVIFTSDNGPWLVMKENGGNAHPLRQGKFTTYEGGYRVPCIMRWPGKIAEQTECKEIASTIDLFPTLAHLVGGTIPQDRTLDGKNIWPLLAQEKGAVSPHSAFFYYSIRGPRAVRSGKWKLRKHQGKAELYDLETDIGEKTNVAEQHPEIVERLSQLMNQHFGEIRKNARPLGRIKK